MDVSGLAEGDRTGGYLQLLCPVNPVFIAASGKHWWGQTRGVSPTVDESRVPCQPDVVVAGLSSGPCGVSLKVRQQTGATHGGLHKFQTLPAGASPSQAK